MVFALKMIGTHHSQQMHRDGPRTPSTTLGPCINMGMKRGQRTFMRCFDENLHGDIFRQSYAALSTQQNAVWNGGWGVLPRAVRKASGEHTEQMF